MKRDRLQVIHDILKAIHDGKKKPTHIMYRANLSHQMLEEYLSDLISKGFVAEEQDKKGKVYVLKEKGFNYLQKYNMIKDFTDSFGLG